MGDATSGCDTIRRLRQGNAQVELFFASRDADKPGSALDAGADAGYLPPTLPEAATVCD
jgi:hypothetical protein